MSALQPSTAPGVYGFRLGGLSGLESHARQVPAQWPQLQVQLSARAVHDSPQPPGTIRRSAAGAELWLAQAGRIVLRRDPLSATFSSSPPLSTEAIMHPFLGLPAAIAGSWLGRLALHGAAFVLDGRAYAVLGARGAGKSTALACLLSRGCQALSDDVLIVEGTTVFAGPRSIDLREDVARRLGGEPLGVIGNRTRWRIRTPLGPAAAALAGLIALDWGGEETIVPLSAEERLRTVFGSLALAPERSSAPCLLALAALPAWRVTRRRGSDAVQAGLDQLLARLTAG